MIKLLSPRIKKRSINALLLVIEKLTSSLQTAAKEIKRLKIALRKEKKENRELEESMDELNEAL